jgi:glutathione S-transferase
MLPILALANNLQVTLWNSGTCPYAQRAWIALKEKDIDFEIRIVDLQNKDDDFETTYYRANPNKLSSSKVPLLEVVDVGSDTEESIVHYAFTESRVLLEVLEELFPNHHHLLPMGIQERYHARVFADAVYDSIWGGERSPYQILARKLKNKESWDATVEKERLVTMLKSLQDSLETFHKDGPFVCGKHFTIAECMTTAPFVQRADFVLKHYLDMDVNEICQKEGFSRAGQWWDAVLNRKSVQETATADPHTSIQRLMDRMKL